MPIEPNLDGKPVWYNPEQDRLYVLMQGVVTPGVGVYYIAYTEDQLASDETAVEKWVWTETDLDRCEHIGYL